MELNGLPLHPLTVHAAVVLTPLACLMAIGYAVPQWRAWLRWPLAVAVVVAVASVWVAYITGDDFRADERFATATGEFAERLDRHEDLGGYLRWVASGFGVVTLAAVALHDRAGAVRWGLALVVVATAVATLVLTFLTGEAGARAVWGQA